MSDCFPVEVAVLGDRLHEVGVLIRRAESLREHREANQAFLQLRSPHRVVDGCIHQAGGDGHDPDAHGCEVAGHRKSHADKAALAGAVRGLTDLAIEGSQGGGHHDRSTLTRGVGLILRHQARGVPGEVVRADQVDLDDASVGIQICG